MLRLIGHNTNYITVSEVIGALWENWHDGKIEGEDEEDPNANDETPMLSANHRPNSPPPPPPFSSKPAIPPKPGMGLRPTAPHMNEERYEDPMYDP